MTGKEKMLRTFQGTESGTAVTPHWWGLYKFQYSGLIDGYRDERKAWDMQGKELADIDGRFYEDFHPDMFHLTTGRSRTGVMIETPEYLEARARMRQLESKKDIDEFMDFIWEDEKSVLDSGVFDHVKILSGKYGEESLIALNEGNPACRILDEYLGFEDGLVAMLEEPELVGYLVYRLYDALLPRMRALKEAGAHAYIGSETYCTRDIISGDLYRSLIFPAQKHFYTELKNMGLIPVTYFLGDVMPLLSDINKLGIQGLMVEESKKGFRLDPVEIRKKLSPEITLFGNLDSVYILQMGTKEQVEEETKRQLAASEYGSFIMANGCPLSFDTPGENIRTMMDTVRRNQE